MLGFLHTISSFLKTKEYRSLLLTTVIVVFFGSVVFHYLEDWSWIDSIYFSVITLSTIGYGDFSPQTDAGKLFAILYIIIGVGIILNFIQTVYQHYEDIRLKRKRK